jgi:hypothetical protein
LTLVTLDKYKNEYEQIFTWLFENVDDTKWETCHGPDVGQIDKAGNIIDRSGEAWRHRFNLFGIKLQVSPRKKLTAYFYFENPSDAMLFKLKWG